jgi:PST family polysaccharide transporter
MQFYRISANNILATTTSTIMAIVLAWQGWGYWALVAKWVTLPLASAIGAWLLCQWRPGRPALSTGVRPMLTFAANTYGSFLLNYLSRNLDKVLIGWRYGSQSLGYYEKAYSFFVMPFNQLSSPLSNVVVSAFSRLRDDPERLRLHYLRALSMMAFIGMPLSAMFTLTGRDFILLLLGPQWGKTGQIFTVFGPCIGVLLVYSTHLWLHLSLGRADRLIRWGIIEMTTSVLAFIIGLPFGAVGVAIAYGLSFYVLLAPGLLYAGKPIDITLSSLLSAIWRYYLCALVAGLLSWFLLYSYEASSVIFLELSTFPRLLVSLSLCASLYLLLIVTLFQGMDPIFQLVSLFRDMKPSFSEG